MSKEYTAEQILRGMDRVMKGEVCIFCHISPVPKDHDSDTCGMA